jgi:hypothetical protein
VVLLPLNFAKLLKLFTPPTLTAHQGRRPTSPARHSAMLTQHSSADKRRVYLAYRTVFAGPNAQLRKHKKVREVIQARQSSFGPLINDFGLEKIIEIVIILLNGRIFQSELKAKIEFPELFRTTPSRDIPRAETENYAVRSEAGALKNLLSADDADERGNNRRDKDKDEDGADDKSSNNPCSSLPSCTDYFSMSSQTSIN